MFYIGDPRKGLFCKKHVRCVLKFVIELASLYLSMLIFISGKAPKTPWKTTSEIQKMTYEVWKDASNPLKHNISITSLFHSKFKTINHL